MKKNIIPLVFAVDDNYVPFLTVALSSIKANACQGNFYKVYVLNTKIKQEDKDNLFKFNGDNMSVELVDVCARMDKISSDKIHLRDYYTQAIYYRIFIPALFPEYEKILYVDCDVVLLEDIANYYNTEINDNIFIAVHEETMTVMDVFGRYSEGFLGVKREDYFNSGLLLINVKEYLKNSIEEKFIDFMHSYKFEVAPDQDYLNVLTNGRVGYQSIGWNKTPFPHIDFPENQLKLIHYKLDFKPWHYQGVKYEEYFWKYAKDTPYYDSLITMRDNYTNEQKVKDAEAFKKLCQTAESYAKTKITFKAKKQRVRYRNEE